MARGSILIYTSVLIESFEIRLYFTRSYLKNRNMAQGQGKTRKVTGGM